MRWMFIREVMNWKIYSGAFWIRASKERWILFETVRKALNEEKAKLPKIQPR